MTDNRFINRSELIGILVLAAFLVVVLPLCLDVFRLNLVAKYLTYAFVALGLVICWGYGGILSLGQGVFFGLGGYCMAMFLKLEASSVENTKIQSTPGIPDFMDWNQITSLPFFWKPFHSLTFTIAAVILVPGIFALIIGAAMFKRRVGGTYFAIITQAVAAILTTPRSFSTSSRSAVCSFASSSPSSSGTPSSVASWSRCATRRIGFVSPVTASRISRSSRFAWLRYSPRSAAPCSRSRSASCRPPLSASCRRSRW